MSLTERCHPFAPFGGIAVASDSVALARSLGAACIPQLEIVLAEGSDAMRAFAIEMLAELAPDGIEARARAVLSDATRASEVKGAALATLARVTSSNSLDVLLQFLEGPPALRMASEAALVGRVDDKLVPRAETLLATLRPGDKRREALARVLGARTEPQAQALVRSWVERGDLLAQEAVLRGAPEPALLWRALDAPDAALRAFALQALAQADGLTASEEEKLLSMFSAASWPSEVPFETAQAIETLAARTFRRPPEDAFEQIATRLDDASPSFAGARASGILRTLTLAYTEAWNEGRGVDANALPSPRWAESLPALTLGADDIWTVNDLRASAERAMRWLRGERDPMWLRSVDLGEGEDEPFPFLVLGWWWYQTDPPSVPPETVRRILQAGFWRFDHQVGGYATLHAELLGVALRLPAAVRTQAIELCEGFETSGEPLDARAFSAIAIAAELPPFSEGVEALVSTDPVTVHTPALEGATRLAFASDIAPWDGVNFYGAPPKIVDADASPRDELSRLYALGRELGLGAPRIMLLWGNSD